MLYFIYAKLKKGVFMLQTIKWEAARRENITQGEMKAKRMAGFVPAVVISRGKESTSVFLNAYDLKKRPFGNFRIELQIEGEKETVDCLLKALQYNHTADSIIHADLQELTKGQELDVEVSFELVGTPVGIKNGGVLNHGISSVMIRTLPRNIPEKIIVDISKLNVGDSLHVSDVKFGGDYTLLEPTEGTIAYISEPRSMESETGSGEISEPEIIKEKHEA